MKISRNIKKITKVSPSAHTSSSPKAIKIRMGKYHYPTIDEVPAGHYMSRITYAHTTQTSTGKDAVEVFYKMLPLIYCYRIMNNIEPENPNMKPFLLRQKYPKKSIFYEEFEDAMLEALDAPKNYKLVLEDIIGIEEKINLAYNSNTAIGGIKDRVVCTMEDLVQQVDDSSDHVNKDNYTYNAYDDEGYINLKND